MIVAGDAQIAAKFVEEGYKCTPRTLLNWRKDKCPGWKKSGKLWSCDFEKVKAWARSNGKLTQRAAPPAEAPADGFIDLRAKKDAEDVVWKQIRNRRAERLELIEKRKLLDVDEATTLFGAILKEHRRHAEALPHTICDAANPDNPKLARKVIGDAIIKIFDVLDRRLREIGDRLDAPD